jgi:apyrase
MATLASKFPAVKPDALPYLCLDLAYCHTLLSQGFALREAQSITLVKQVPYNGQNVECAWPLGAAINDLSA